MITLLLETLIRESSAEALEAAAALYQGDLLDGIRVREPPFEESLLGERERLRELALDALARLQSHQLGSCPAGPAIRTAMRILTLDPAREAVHRDLMQLFERQGRHGDALRQYRLCLDALHRELGVEPDAQTRRLYQDIARAETIPAARDNAGPAVVAPSPRGSPDEAVRQLPPLIGRGAEPARLGEALDAARRGEGRLVVSLGETGIGKSSLQEALEAEARRRDVRCHLGRSYLSEQVLAFAPWIDALRAADVVSDPQILACLGPVWVEELSRLIPDLRTGSPRRAGETGVQPLFEAVVRLVSCLAVE